MTPAPQRIAVAVLARLLPPEFRDRQRAEWSADLADLGAAGAATRWRYVLAVAWTLPALRHAVRGDRVVGPSRMSPHGLRAGLGRPDAPGIVVLAVLVSLLTGMFGAAWATRAGWEYATPLPAGASADELAQTVFPGLTVTGDGDASLWTVPGEHAEFGAARYVVDPADTRPVPSVWSAIQARLTAASWHPVANPDAGVPGFALSRQAGVLTMAVAAWC